MKKGLKIVGNILLWIFLCIAIFMTIVAFTSTKNKNGVAVLFGSMPITIITDSMDPTLKSGDLIISKELDDMSKTLLPDGEIITYKVDLDGDGFMEFNTHRIVSSELRSGIKYYVTKGDNNPIADQEEVRFDNVVGVYTGRRVAHVGKVLNFLQTPRGFMIFIVIPLLLFLLYEIYNFVRVVVSIKTEKHDDTYEEEIKRKAIEEYLAQQKITQEAENKKE